MTDQPNVSSTLILKRMVLQPFTGVSSFIFMSSNALFWTLLAHLVAPLLLLKNTQYEAFAERCFNRLYEGWAGANEWWFQHVLGINWELDDTMKVDFQHWHF